MLIFCFVFFIKYFIARKLSQINLNFSYSYAQRLIEATEWWQFPTAPAMRRLALANKNS